MLLSKHRAQDIPVQKKNRGVVRHILKNRQVICSASLPVYLDTAETEIGAFSGLARCAAIPGSGCPPLLMRTLREEYLGRGDASIVVLPARPLSAGVDSSFFIAGRAPPILVRDRKVYYKTTTKRGKR